MQFGNWKEKFESDSKTLRWQVTRRAPLTNDSRKRAYASQPRVLRGYEKIRLFTSFRLPPFSDPTLGLVHQNAGKRLWKQRTDCLSK